MDPKCWGLPGRSPRQASVPMRWLCEHGCLLEHKEANPGSEKGGEAGSSPSRKGQEEPCLVRSVRPSCPGGASRLFFLFLLHELSQTSSARFTQEPGLHVRTFYYFRRKHLQSASESSGSLVNLPAAGPSSLQT